MTDRITRETMLTEIATVVSRRSTCPRKAVGAVIAIDGRILSLGYNGTPAGLPHCTEVGCNVGPDGGCTRAVHAELNAIAFAAKQGISLDGSTLYVTISPCLKCAQAIINAGIIGVWYLKMYRDLSGISLLEEAGVDHGGIPYQHKI
jgi:dCMP deaminase